MSERLSKELHARFAQPGLPLDEAIELLASPDDKAEGDRVWKEMHDEYERDPNAWNSAIDPFEDRAKRKILQRSLISFLQDSTLIASGYCGEDRKPSDIDGALWLENWGFCNNEATCDDLEMTYKRVRIRLPDIATSKPGEGQTSGPTKTAGRNPREDWPLLMAEWVRTIAAHGLPQSKAEAFSWICDAADKLNVPHPAESTFREQVKRTFGDSFWNEFSR